MQPVARRRARAQHCVIARRIIGEHDSSQLVLAWLRTHGADRFANGAGIIVGKDEHAHPLLHAATDR
jgi:hypothetical protein